MNTVDEAEAYWVEFEGEVRGPTRVVKEVVQQGIAVYVPWGYVLSQPNALAARTCLT